MSGEVLGDGPLHEFDMASVAILVCKRFRNGEPTGANFEYTNQ
jgi:hypothetical protein